MGPTEHGWAICDRRASEGEKRLEYSHEQHIQLVIDGNGAQAAGANERGQLALCPPVRLFAKVTELTATGDVHSEHAG